MPISKASANPTFPQLLRRDEPMLRGTSNGST